MVGQVDSQPVAEDARTRVFLSYSRKGAALVQRVARAFEIARARGEETIRIRLSPPELGAIKLEIRVDNGVAVKGTYWDGGGALLKELEASDVRALDPKTDKWQAFHLTMHNRKTGHRTELVFTNLEVGVGLRDEEFSERYLDKES